MDRLQTCPKCRALLKTGTRRCPYCETAQGAVTALSPEEDVRRTGRLALWLLGACLVVYLLSVVLDPARGDREGSAMDPSYVANVIFGGQVQYYVTQCGQVWRYVSSIFVHLDLFHLVMNCVALFIVMPLAGARFGVHRSWVLFLSTGLIASMCSGYFAKPFVVSAGASGAICGLIAALYVYGKRRKGFDGDALSRRMLGWGVLILAYGLIMNQVGGPFGGIGNIAHIAGFVSGAGLGWYASAVRVRGGRADRVWSGASILCTGLVAATAFFLVINVWHGQERREVLLFDSSVQRAMRYLIEPVGADGVARRRPRRLVDAPAGSADVRDAVNRLLELDEKGATGPKRKLAYAEADARWRVWQRRLDCSHQMEFFLR